MGQHYREPPELAEGGNKGSSGTEGNHRKTGREAERPPRSSSGGQLGNQITAPRRSTRAHKRVKRQEAAKQQTAKGSNCPEPQGNPQGALSLRGTKRERHVSPPKMGIFIVLSLYILEPGNGVHGTWGFGLVA